MNDFVVQSDRRSVVGLIGLLVVVVSLVEVNWKQPGIDYLHFWAVPQSMRFERTYELPDESCYTQKGRVTLLRWLKDQALSVDERESRVDSSFVSLVAKNEKLYKEGVAPTGTPLLYASLGVIQTGWFSWDYRIFQFVSALFLVCGMVSLATASGVKRHVALGVTLAAALLYLPIVTDAGVANTNRLQLGMVTIGLACCARFRVVGCLLVGALVLGFAVVFKPNTILVPFFVAVLLLREHGFRQALLFSLGCVGGGAIGVLGATVFFNGFHCWWQWAEYLRTVDGLYPLEAGNCSWINLFLVPPLVGAAVGVVLVLCVCGAICYPRMRPSQLLLPRGEGLDLPISTGRQIMLAGSLGLLVPLLSAPLAWGHYYSLALPTIFLTGATLFGDNSRFRFNRVASLVWLVAVLVVSAKPFAVFGVTTPTVIALSLNLGVVALFAVANLQLLYWPKPVVNDAAT